MKANINLTFTTPVLVVLALSSSVNAQGTFQNLNFEAASVSGYSPGSIPTVDGIPEWAAYIGNTPQANILYNDLTLGTASVDILSPPYGVIDGQYSVMLQSGRIPGGTSSATASIAQSGTIPANAQSLQFEAYDANSLLSVSFAGNSLSAWVIGSGRSPSGIPYNVYGIDIAPYEGQYGQLEFTASPSGNVELDDIAFSPNVVPEPNIAVLTAIGGLLFGTRKWLARR